MAFDPTKPVQTRDGRKVRILCADRKSESGYVVVGLVTTNDGNESPQTWLIDGCVNSNGDDRPWDLVNIPQPHKHADVIKAWADGAEVQCRQYGCIIWHDTAQPQWRDSVEYRVKP